ncbi:UDP-glucosyltransferase precursor [Bombyx mori]|uniref:UDP-glucuronosyltransferase n=1 Tax=Bombyx mori TaxID=7091 RepID=D6RUV2_BOMMO|nr:UDP-glucosyltransferase precursor [Bombyx mori]AEW43172.1 UDP-glycosyltransferase UGT40N1 [Bombyx mori]BAJ08159.1 UDP-glucosyltransferase [Bombyx mori]
MRSVLGLCLIFLANQVQGYTVLVITALPFRSLNILGASVVSHLLNAGHEVTYITTSPLKEKPKKNYREIDVSANTEIFKGEEMIDIACLMDNKVEMNHIFDLQNITIANALMTFENEDVKKLIQNTNESFDVVIADYIDTEVYAAFSALYGCPLIWLSSLRTNWQTLRLIDEPTNPAYTVSSISMNYPPLNFKQRIEELWAQWKWQIVKRLYIVSQEEKIYDNHFVPFIRKRGIKPPNYEDLIYNASLVLANDHHSLGNLPKTPQNFKQVGGFHISSVVKPLDKVLQNIMDSSKDGVVYFSMGSAWQSKDIPEHIVNELLKVFGNLKQTVIWKFEKNLNDLPKNVHIVQWAPQTSILAHPNCLLFISHGGLLSSTEAIHFGVPIIGIPIFYDQFVNIQKAVISGYGIQVKLNYELPKSLEKALGEMLSDKKYREKAKQLSLIFHDRPVSPGAELVHWVEHVVKTRGALHLRSPALHVPFYQKLYLDLLAAIAMTLLMIKLVIEKTLSSFYKKTLKRKED